MYQNTENNQQSDSHSLLKRRQQIGFLQPLELPSLPPLSQLLTEKEKLEQQKNIKLSTTEELPITPNTQAATEAALAAASAVTSSMITSTTQSLNTDLYSNNPILNPTHIKQESDPIGLLQESPFNMHTTPSSIHVNNNNTTSQPIENLILNNEFLDPQQHMFNLAATNAFPTSTNLVQPQQLMERQRQSSISSTSSDKVYSFVSIPVTTQRKRPRRRYDEIERLYHCTWPGCTKAYGTLNHLNAHVSMQQHGPKRHPSEFKEMRKEWRRQKKAKEAAKKSAELAYKQQEQEQLQNHLLQQPPFPFQHIPNNMTFGHFY